MLVEKEVIRPGTYWYKDESTGLPRKLVVTPELTKYWCEQGNAMLSAGLTVPVPCEHDFDAHPMTPADKLINNAGWVKQYELKGDALFSAVDITDEEIHKKLPRTIRWTSPWINSFTDGAGREWKNVISHLALTTRPRIIEQQPFGSVAAALSMATDIKSWDEVGSKGLYLSRAGLLDDATDLPRFPVAFSLFSGTPLSTDASGHQHGEGGKFAGVGETSGKTSHKIGSEVSSDANKSTRKANKSGSAHHHRHAANMHRGAASYLRGVGEHGLAGEHEAAATAHQHEHDKRTSSTAMAIDFGKKPPTAKPKPKPGAMPDAADPDADGDAAADADDDGDGISDDLEGDDSDLDADGVPDMMEGANADIGMEELLCDLLQALGVPMPDESNEQEFKRHLYEAVMSKIKELTSEGMGKAKDKFEPDQNKPTNQQPNASQPNPLIKQEQQPMYMSLQDISKIADPTMKNIALSMYNENVKLRAQVESGEKTANSLRDAKLKEEGAKRASRVAMLGKLSPKVKGDLDAMLALPAMALSMGDGGAVVDPMAQTLAVLEKGLADMPRLLTSDHSALSVQPQPQDADMLTEERTNELADGLARQMGAPAQKKAG